MWLCARHLNRTNQRKQELQVRLAQAQTVVQSRDERILQLEQEIKVLKGKIEAEAEKLNKKLEEAASGQAQQMQAPIFYAFPGASLDTLRHFGRERDSSLSVEPHF